MKGTCERVLVERAVMTNAQLLIIVVISVARAQNVTYQDADELTRYLFDDTRYNKQVRPLLNQSQALEVRGSIVRATSEMFALI